MLSVLYGTVAVHHKELTGEDLIELEDQRKDKERQEEEEVTEEPKRLTVQERAGGFSLLEEALLAFETLDPNVEQYMKFAAAVQNAIQHYRAIYDERKKKKKSYHPDITESFFQEGRENCLQ